MADIGGEVIILCVLIASVSSRMILNWIIKSRSVVVVRGMHQIFVFLARCAIEESKRGVWRSSYALGRAYYDSER